MADMDERTPEFLAAEIKRLSDELEGAKRAYLFAVCAKHGVAINAIVKAKRRREVAEYKVVDVALPWGYGTGRDKPHVQGCVKLANGSWGNRVFRLYSDWTLATPAQVDRSPKGGDSEAGSVHESAVANGDAP